MKQALSRTIPANESYIRASIINPGTDVREGYANIMALRKDIPPDKEIAEIIRRIEGMQ